MHRDSQHLANSPPACALSCSHGTTSRSRATPSSRVRSCLRCAIERCSPCTLFRNRLAFVCGGALLMVWVDAIVPTTGSLFPAAREPNLSTVIPIPPAQRYGALVPPGAAMPRLADPLDLNAIRLPGRLVMAPMVTGMAEDHAVSDALVAWYAHRAATGLGLVIVESTAVDPDALLLPKLLGAWDDRFVPGLARLASTIQGAGVPALLQIVHGGARSWRADPAQPRLGPSAVPLLPGPPPRTMSEDEILAVIDAFAAAAHRAQAAGFAGVEVHAAHYYLLSEFLSPFANRRSDRWGGSREGRARLALETVRAVRQAVRSDFLIAVRMHAVEFVEGGMSPEDARWTAQALVEAGVDLLDASGIGQSSLGEWEGNTFLNTSSVLPKTLPGGTFAPHAGRLREGLGVPLIAVGKLAEPGRAQAVLDAGQADLVALGRQLIADPDSARKLLEGRDAELQRCQECLTCFAAIRTGAVKCSVNRSL